MLNESLILLSFDELKSILFKDLTIFHMALVYIIMYVVYKTLGRYIYFKPQEHASKINRTFLTLSLLIVLIYTLNFIEPYLPFLPEYRWLYILCCIVVLIAPLSMGMDRIIWKYYPGMYKQRKQWSIFYLPIQKDYSVTSIHKTESKGNYTEHFEVEGVESTEQNIHSDVLLNILALTTFIIIDISWSYKSAVNYGVLSYVFSGVISVIICGIFINNTIFSWIKYLEDQKDKDK